MPASGKRAWRAPTPALVPVRPQGWAGTLSFGGPCQRSPSRAGAPVEREPLGRWRVASCLRPRGPYPALSDSERRTFAPLWRREAGRVSATHPANASFWCRTADGVRRWVARQKLRNMVAGVRCVRTELGGLGLSLILGCACVRPVAAQETWAEALSRMPLTGQAMPLNRTTLFPHCWRPSSPTPWSKPSSSCPPWQM